MIQLNSFGNLLESKSSLGYVWSRNTGWRILIVIDDWFDIPVWEPEDDGEVESSHAFGLTLLRDKVSELETTRAIGFFSLPDPSSTRLQDHMQHLVDGISEWLTKVKDDQCRGYIMVDYYYGEGFVQAHQVGTKVVDYWKSQEEALRDKLSMDVKLSHISIGGTRKTSNPHGLQVFRKTEINAIQKLPNKLKEWLDINEHPLTRLWHESENWFLAERDNDDVMKHTTGNIQEYLDTPEDGRLREYRRNVESAMGLKLPDGWWQNAESIGAIHESLKCLCGGLACSECSENTTKRAVSTGAAFLIALMAHQQQCGDISALTCHENMWTSYSRVATSFVFAKQDCSTAKETAIALYDLYRLLFEVRDRAETNGDSRTSQVKNVMFADKGRLLRIELSWNAHQRSMHNSLSLAERMTTLFQDTVIKIPAAPPVNTRESLLRLWALMAISEDGCFSPGVVYLENNILTIGSVK
ncbi:MAG: hypothetical protein AAGD25_16015 [Cyanobacteria bacterium P01_F01_bin.150]